MIKRAALCIAMGLTALSMAACSSFVSSALEPRPDLSRFFVLTPISDSGASAPVMLSSATAGPSLGLGPVTLPEYLSRPEIVTRADPNRIDLSDHDRWAEPLSKNFSAVLAQNLSTLLGTSKLVIYPWYPPATFDYQVTVAVSRLDTDTAGTAVLKARWEIRDPNADATIRSGESDISDAKLSGEAAAATLSRALGDMSREIADAVRALPRRPKPTVSQN